MLEALRPNVQFTLRSAGVHVMPVGLELAIRHLVRVGVPRRALLGRPVSYLDHDSIGRRMD